MNLLSATLAEPQHFSLAEKALFLALAAASIALFWRRFGPVLGRILASRKDPDFHLAPIGRRAWDFFAEVLCQAKVIRQRPLPGLAHALVFWGFCSFVLVTLNHWAVALGLGFLNPASCFGRIYFYTAAAFALACAIGIAGLFIRRFFVRPRWLGKKVSPESGVIAGFIFLLMVTYLAAFFTTDASPAARALWWIHTLTLLIFLPIIPHTKHLHLILSPVTIFLSRGSFSRIPPLVGDEDFGLVTGKDLTRIVSLQAYSCVECGRCSEHCPATNTGKELNPKEIILGVRAFLNGPGPASEEALLGKYNSQTAVFQCTTCGACEFQCPVGIEHVPIMVGLRRGAVNTGTWEDDYGAKLFNQLERGSNALGISALERDKFIQKQGFPIFDGTQEYCLWLGCMGGYDPKGREIVTAFAQVMNYLGTSYGVLKKEKCTGDPVRRLGNDLLFQTLAEENLKNLAQNKVKKIVSICPHCVRTIQEDWKAYGTPPEIEHHTEFMAKFADRLPKFSNVGLVSGHELQSCRKQPGKRRGFSPCVRPRNHRLPRPLLPRPLPQRLRPTAPTGPNRRHARRSSAPQGAQLLLRRRRRARIFGRGNRRTRKPCPRQRTRSHRRRNHRHRLSLLQLHVPRRSRRDGRHRTATARRRPTHRPQPARPQNTPSSDAARSGRKRTNRSSFAMPEPSTQISE